ncbi:unnamed protein product [Vitrella brassicaformis CCMP3155]|uniref:beta-mannosidase n=2 Tax=Vitrella brassicaformis TaxID=1169539 RepID=A0A0G4GY42_VITBC|nr:unnamed protein product [Vitrella brassicaformis CCMP3155]|eukprot:CEM35958.1 unnamed protein product [Vitrella brassicaformis CCMP3155]
MQREADDASPTILGRQTNAAEADHLLQRQQIRRDSKDRDNRRDGVYLIYGFLLMLVGMAVGFVFLGIGWRMDPGHAIGIPPSKFYAPYVIHLAESVPVSADPSLSLGQHRSAAHDDDKMSHIAVSWRLTSSNDTSHPHRRIDCPASPPSSVYEDLLACGVLKDGHPYYRFNELRYRWVALSNWTYTASFVLTGTHLRHRIVLLDLHGVDTFAQVRLNGHQVGTLDNMFVKYTFQIQPYLRLGRNELSFRFANAIHVGEREAARFPYPVPVTENLYDLPNRNFVRKAQSDFGWDWGPGFAPMGIWRSVHAVGLSEGRIEHVVTDQVFEGNGLSAVKVTSEVGVLLDPCMRGDLMLSATFMGQTLSKKIPPGDCRSPPSTSSAPEPLHSLSFTFSFHVTNPPLWWPRGYSGTPGRLVPLNVTLGVPSSPSLHLHVGEDHDGSIDRRVVLVGLRRVRLVREPLTHAASLKQGERIENWPYCRSGIEWYQKREPSLTFCEAYGKVRAEGQTWDNELGEYCGHPDCCDTTHGKFSQCNKCPASVAECSTSYKPESFYFEVNGVPVYAKGANVIPFSSFHATVTQEDVEAILESALAAEMNMLRVWGGGIYQEEYFYDWCDAHGILVWQEFIFACAMYPTHKPFLDNVRQEVRIQVRRLASHPSIVIWGGSNENEAALQWYRDSQSNRDLYLSEYNVLYIDTIHDEFRKVGPPSAIFLDSSPTNGPLTEYPDTYRKQWGDPYDIHRGDVHFYDYGIDCLKTSHYPRAKFVSEFGFQSLPSILAYAGLAEPADLTLSSNFSAFRMRHPGGNRELIEVIGKHFSLPPSQHAPAAVPDEAYLRHADLGRPQTTPDITSGLAGALMEPLALSRLPKGAQDFASLTWLSQLEQSMCYDAAISYWRRLKSDKAVMTMGVLYWQLNDVWQGPSWSSLEYSGKWKPLHYAARSFFGPLMVRGEYVPRKDTTRIYAVSDINERLDGGTLQVQLVRFRDGAVLWREELGELSLAPLSAAVIHQFKISRAFKGLPPSPRRRTLDATTDTDLRQHLLCSPNDCFFTMQLSFNDSKTQTSSKSSSHHAEGHLVMCPYKLADLSRAEVSVEGIDVQGAAAKVRVKAAEGGGVAMFVWLESPMAGRFSDNGFHLLPGASREVTFECRLDCSFALSNFTSTLLTRNLYDTFASYQPHNTRRLDEPIDAVPMRLWEFCHDCTREDPDLKLHGIFSSHMVLPRAPQQARIWGWAKKGVTVTIRIEQKTSTSKGSDPQQFSPSYYVRADEDTGAWELLLPRVEASAEGRRISVSTSEGGVLLEDVVFGDVWLCSGQSNMQMTLNGDLEGQEYITTADRYPHIRMFTVNLSASDTPREDLSSLASFAWAPSRPQSFFAANESATHSNLTRDHFFKYHSAVCYTFGRHLDTLLNHQAEKEPTVPIGLVTSAWGGQRIESFMSAAAINDLSCGGVDGSPVRPLRVDGGNDRPVGESERSGAAMWWQALDAYPMCREAIEAYNRTKGGVVGVCEGWRKVRQGWTPSCDDRPDQACLSDGFTANNASACPPRLPGCSSRRDSHCPWCLGPRQVWNGLLHPLKKVDVKGVIWYQGEQDTSDSSDLSMYSCRFPAFVADVRHQWLSPELPFWFVQLAAYEEPSALDFKTMRWQQTSALQLPHTGMVSAVDLGDPTSPLDPIHPRHKAEIGKRLATQIAGHVYGIPIPATSIPPSLVPSGTKTARGRIVLAFSHGDGLHTAGTRGCRTCCDDANATTLFDVQVERSAEGGKKEREREWVGVPLAKTIVDSEGQAGRVELHLDGLGLGLGEGEGGGGEGGTVLGVRMLWYGYPQCALYSSGKMVVTPFVMDLSPRNHSRQRARRT